jgi:hypothetical protein
MPPVLGVARHDHARQPYPHGIFLSTWGGGRSSHRIKPTPSPELLERLQPFLKAAADIAEDVRLEERMARLLDSIYGAGHWRYDPIFNWYYCDDHDGQTIVIEPGASA